MQEPSSPPSKKQADKPKPPRMYLKLVQHSNVFYWWPVWLYGYICAAVTYLYGTGVAQLAAGPGKVILFHPDPFLGWSFVCVLLATIYLSNSRSRGIYSFIALAVFVFAFYFVPQVPGYARVGEWLSLLRIHLNLAFYVAFSTMLLGLWLLVFLVLDRLAWVRVTPGQVAEEHRFGQGTGFVCSTEGLIVQRLPDDLFRHKLLGLRLFGIGTGDFVFRPNKGETMELHNVWRANAKQLEIERLIATKVITSI